MAQLSTQSRTVTTPPSCARRTRGTTYRITSSTFARRGCTALPFSMRRTLPEPACTMKSPTEAHGAKGAACWVAARGGGAATTTGSAAATTGSAATTTGSATAALLAAALLAAAALIAATLLATPAALRASSTVLRGFETWNSKRSGALCTRPCV